MPMLPYRIALHLRYRRLEIGRDPAKPELLGWLFLLAGKHTLDVYRPFFLVRRSGTLLQNLA